MNLINVPPLPALPALVCGYPFYLLSGPDHLGRFLVVCAPCTCFLPRSWSMLGPAPMVGILLEGSQDFRQVSYLE